MQLFILFLLSLYWNYATTIHIRAHANAFYPHWWFSSISFPRKWEFYICGRADHNFSRAMCTFMGVFSGSPRIVTLTRVNLIKWQQISSVINSKLLTKDVCFFFIIFSILFMVILHLPHRLFIAIWVNIGEIIGCLIAED